MNKPKLIQYFFFINFLLILFSAKGQEFNYWTQQVGSRSSMLSGAVTAGCRDNSAIFYNPGALAYINNSSLSVVGNVYFYSSLQIEDGAGQDERLRSSVVDGAPQIFSGIRKFKNNPYYTVNYALLNKELVHFNINKRIERNQDVIESRSGDEYFIGDLSYFNRIREDWLGIGWANQFFKGIGIGGSIFFTYRSQHYSDRYYAIVSEEVIDNSIVNTLAYANIDNMLDFNSLGLLAIIGFNYERKHHSFGITITTPRINFNLFDKASLRRNANVFFENDSSLYPSFSLYYDKMKTYYRSPLIIDLGAEFSLNKTRLALKVSYFSKINPYSLVEINDNDLEQEVDEQVRELASVKTANKTTFNIAVGVEHHFSEKFKTLGGFRTDFNYFDSDKVNPEKTFTPGLTYWDLYHISGGVAWRWEKFTVDLGISYAFGYSKGDLQMVNMDNPNEENFLMGYTNYDTRTFYNQVNLLVGFTYYFSRM